MILLVLNRKGLKNLYEMISQSYLKYFHKTPRIPKSLLQQHREGILVGSACGMGELYGAVMRGESDAELRKIASLYDYLEIQPLANNGFLVDEGRVASVDVLKDFNRRILDLGRAMGKPVVAASDVHFLDPEDEQYRRILQAAKKFSDPDRPCPIYFRTTDEMLKEAQGPGIHQNAPDLRRNAAAPGPGARGRGAQHHSRPQLRRDLHVGPEAGPELPRARLPGGQPWQRRQQHGRLYVRHYGSELPSGPLCLPGVPLFGVPGAEAPVERTKRRADPLA